MSLSSGRSLGPYEIVGQIGAGGMGEVYKAKDTRLGRDVAIEVPPAHLVSTRDARSYAYRYMRILDELYLAEGPK